MAFNYFGTMTVISEKSIEEICPREFQELKACVFASRTPTELMVALSNNGNSHDMSHYLGTALMAKWKALEGTFKKKTKLILYMRILTYDPHSLEHLNVYGNIFWCVTGIPPFRFSSQLNLRTIPYLKE